VFEKDVFTTFTLYTAKEMSKIEKTDLDELIEHRIISADIAVAIENYYKNKVDESPSKLLLVFGILGAVLGGLGIILVFAHNWDDFSITVKCILSVVPLALGQLLCAFTLFKKPESLVWRESSAAFLFLSIGASLALIAQTYNIPGDFSSFILTWSLLGLPLIYALKSQVASLLYLIGITTYCVSYNYSNNLEHENHWYWLLLVAAFPNYYFLIKEKIKGNFTAIHHYFIVLSITICLGSLANNNDDTLIFYNYVFLFGLFYFIGKSKLFLPLKRISNSYAIIGKLGGLYLLYMASFKWMWEEILSSTYDVNRVFFGIGTVLFLALLFRLYQLWKAQQLHFEPLIQYSFLVVVILFFIDEVSRLLAVIVTNFYLLFIGIMEINRGNKENSIARMNFGILIIAVLITCRFFDTNMSFVVRGVLFILVGIGFFTLNYYMLRKKNINEKQ
jgi:uncharacterized membrane protein